LVPGFLPTLSTSTVETRVSLSLLAQVINYQVDEVGNLHEQACFFKSDHRRKRALLKSFNLYRLLTIINCDGEMSVWAMEAIPSISELCTAASPIAACVADEKE
jgi:hypothetical protein